MGVLDRMEIRLKSAGVQSLDPVAKLPGLNPGSSNYCKALANLFHIAGPVSSSVKWGEALALQVWYET